MTREVVIGDISDSWKISHKDSTGRAAPLDSNYSCFMKVIGSDGEEVISRQVTKIQDDAFVVYLDEADTGLLIENRNYIFAVELRNPALPKPLKKEASREFKAVKGYI